MATADSCQWDQWESELLQVSSELKQKLLDPHFVAMRCDLDGSGDLDVHELKQAAQVFGTFQSRQKDEERLQALMAGQPRISKERFAEIVAELNQSADFAKPLRTVPHSLRGMALGQLKRLETMFIKSGWLAQQCESFNQSHRMAIQEGKRFQQCPNLYAFDTFVVTPMSTPGHCAAREQDAQQTIPCATRASSFSELLNPYGLYVHSFVSHYWGHLFSSTVRALGLWANGHSQRLQVGHIESVVFWICLFALNQHDVTAEVGQNPRQGPFNAALAQAAAGAVMVLDEQINPFKRIWCLFEVSRLKDLQKPFELICDLGPFSELDSRASQSDAGATKMLQATCQALWEVSASKAQSSTEADKYRIWAETADRHWRSILEPRTVKEFFDTIVDKEGLDGLGGLCFSTFDDYIRSLLSTSMLRVLLARGDYVPAAECCRYGASFTEEQLIEICTSFATIKERAAWLNVLIMNAREAPTAELLLKLGSDPRATDNDGKTVLMLAAQRGHESVAKVLLENGAEIGAANKAGATALMYAAQGGHESLTKLLLEQKANAGAADKDGVTALQLAAFGGHELVAKLLLEHGADTQAANHTGITTLMYAAQGGHESLAKLLLEYGANACVGNNTGGTALMSASECGNESLAKLLLENGANADATNEDGSTALMYAALGGHESLTKLLLDHGANANAADQNGSTALQLAAFGGHESVAKLLLQNGASAMAPENAGVSALKYAVQGDHESLAKLLLEYGAG
ncbi:unnamed protein product [Durusdinium trenchii]|uniref:Ankyrin repeat domain-containing protein 50 n=2 Tax=Durusdinium trenchii TaxID=1381693 RepID=A0ABP0S9Y7_9DINO